MSESSSKLSIHPFNNINRFWSWMGVLFVGFMLVIWLYPDYLYYIDPWFLLLPWALFVYALGGHIYAEAHRGGFSLTTYLGHTSIAEPEPTTVIPAQEPWPRMAAFRKGDGRYGRKFIVDGPKTSGWLVVPEEHVVDMNGHQVAFTRTIELEVFELPDHVKNHLEKRADFVPHGFIEFGLDPFDPSWSEPMKAKNTFRWDIALKEASARVTELNETVQAMRKNIRGMNRDLEVLGERERHEPKRGTLATMTGGEDGGR